jgi:hypothetical protein
VGSKAQRWLVGDEEKNQKVQEIGYHEVLDRSSLQARVVPYEDLNGYQILQAEPNF